MRFAVAADLYDRFMGALSGLPFTRGVGAAGEGVLDPDRDRGTAPLEHCRSVLGDGPCRLRAHAWAARGCPRPAVGRG